VPTSVAATRRGKLISCTKLLQFVIRQQHYLSRQQNALLRDGNVYACVIDLAGQLKTGAAAAAASRVEWDMESVVVHQGDNITLVCTARAVDFFDVVRLTLTPSLDYVATPGLPQSVAESARPRWTIADNDAVKLPFLALPRYGVMMTVNGRRAVVQLQITGQ